MGGRKRSASKLRPRAAEDVLECAAYLAEHAGLVISLRFVAALERTQADLLSQPELGSPRTLESPKLAGLRQWRVKGFTDYLVFYLPKAHGIEIVRVLHAARDRDAILGAEE